MAKSIIVKTLLNVKSSENDRIINRQKYSRHYLETLYGKKKTPNGHPGSKKVFQLFKSQHKKTDQEFDSIF